MLQFSFECELLQSSASGKRCWLLSIATATITGILSSAFVSTKAQKKSWILQTNAPEWIEQDIKFLFYSTSSSSRNGKRGFQGDSMQHNVSYHYCSNNSQLFTISQQRISLKGCFVCCNSSGKDDKLLRNAKFASRMFVVVAASFSRGDKKLQLIMMIGHNVNRKVCRFISFLSILKGQNYHFYLSLDNRFFLSIFATP